jgi:AcrR family transcriptional regulator
MTQPQPTERLSRERILAAALELTAREGPAALSMRRIAQELDVWPMSLYRYFRDKDELLDALAGSAADEIGPPAGDGPWRDELADLLRQARAAFERHPGGARLHRDRRLHETGVAVLRRAGLDRAEAVAAWESALAYAAGAAALALAPKRFEYGLLRLLDGLDPR